jgi:hypothetical protein
MAALTPYKPVMLDLKVPLIVDVHYEQADKEKRERGAMDKIIARERSLFREGTPERIRMEKAIAFMGMEKK